MSRSFLALSLSIPAFRVNRGKSALVLTDDLPPSLYNLVCVMPDRKPRKRSNLDVVFAQLERVRRENWPFTDPLNIPYALCFPDGGEGSSDAEDVDEAEVALRIPEFREISRKYEKEPWSRGVGDPFKALAEGRLNGTR